LSIGEKIEEDGPIEPDTPHEQIRKEPYVLPKEFEWTTLDTLFSFPTLISLII